ncbi:MAG: 30S ribosomal protein S4 [Candidatus Omnitrophica bacterium]|nr:30S ribosomal protein S4 [Candidatus Omnitrophota bacterium]MBU4478482.1 30S ribosomal protein S4 [Candidatus Omnitrophota bacterium]MCG2703783.1 30S ribosomal protein S4 [Candidatus Omnitrophota bacterium]
MARNIGPSCRICRREGAKLFLKGVRCSSEKCAFNRRSYPSGQHGKNRIKVSDYGVQLREKQKVKRIYGVLERQFRRYFHEANRVEGVTGELLLQLLERRLDNVVLRAGFATSLAQARQLVRYGHVRVNDRKVDIPSYQVTQAQTVQMYGKESLVKQITETLEVTKDRTVPSWLNIDKTHLKAQIAKLPSRQDVPFAVQEQLIVELYSK